ncbi:MAG: YdcF family protein [Firmicutes bacterium]|nr:YdcF family protein [Bacillota bacterium]
MAVRGRPRRRPRRLLLAASGLAAVALVLLAVHPVLLAALGRWLVVADSPVPADAIVVLGGDWQGRIQQGIRLYREGWAPLLLVTGGMAIAPGRVQAAYLAEVARRAGVPSQAILTQRESRSTWEDAALTVGLARERGWRRVLLVTSDWHSRRAAMVFRRGWGPAGVEVRSVPSAEWRFDLERWWQDPDGGETVIIEWIRLVWYWLRARP